MNKLTQKSPFWLIPVLLFFGIEKIKGQNLVSVAQVGNEHLQSLTQLVNNGDKTYWSGVFKNELTINESTLESKGEEDIVVAEVLSDLNSRPFLVGGSERDDALTAMAIDHDGNLIIAGSFWRSISFKTFQASSFEFLHFDENPRALFLFKISPDGQLLWHHLFRGGGIKMIDDIAVNAMGDISIGGFFREELFVDGYSLEKTGVTSGFTALVRPSGTIEWIDTFGDTGDSRVTAITFGDDITISVTGWYNDTLKIGNSNIPANTNDKDGYIASYDLAGEIQWAHRAGGVFDEEPRAMIADEEGNTYITGQLVGVMTLNDSLSIQSRDGNADCFLLKYNAQGDAIWAQSFGGDQLQISNDITISEESIHLVGAFEQNLFIQDAILESLDQFDGYLASFAFDGRLQKLLILPTHGGSALPRQVVNQNNEQLLGGDFSGRLRLNNQNLQTDEASDFEIFIARFNALSTSTTQASETENESLVFPNPFQDRIYLSNLDTSDQITIFDTSGKLYHQGPAQQEFIATKTWAAGAYYMLISNTQQDSQRQVKLIKK